MRDTGRNPWDVLGVAEDAPYSEVKRAYVRLARTTHPDAPGGSNEAFRVVQAAFEALQRRPAPTPAAARPTPYDRWLHRPSQRPRQWTDDDPLVERPTGVAPARRATFMDLLSSELLRQRHHAA